MEKFNVYYLHINFNEDINNYIPNPMILQNINNRIRTPNSIDYFNEDLNLTFIN